VPIDKRTLEDLFFFGDGDWAEDAVGRENMKNTEGGSPLTLGTLRANTEILVSVHMCRTARNAHKTLFVTGCQRRCAQFPALCDPTRSTKGWVPFVITPGVTKVKLVKKDIPPHLAKLDFLGNSCRKGHAH